MAVDQQRRRAVSNPAMHGELAPFCLSRGFGAGSARRRSAVLPHRLALTGEARVHGLTRHPRGLIALRWTGGNLLHNIAHKIPGSERSASSTIRPTRCFCCGLIAAARALSPNFCSLSLRRSELTRILLGLGARHPATRWLAGEGASKDCDVSQSHHFAPSRKWRLPRGCQPYPVARQGDRLPGASDDQTIRTVEAASAHVNVVCQVSTSRRSSRSVHRPSQDGRRPGRSDQRDPRRRQQRRLTHPVAGRRLNVLPARRSPGPLTDSREEAHADRHARAHWTNDYLDLLVDLGKTDTSTQRGSKVPISSVV